MEPAKEQQRKKPCDKDECTNNNVEEEERVAIHFSSSAKDVLFIISLSSAGECHSSFNPTKLGKKQYIEEW